MAVKLPPMNSLVVFVSAAKHESFVKAADELCVTNGAVSKQIALLENYLGVSLFERRNNGLTLTKDGRKYFASLKGIFEKVEQATMECMKKDKDSLNINILPSLTLEWMTQIITDLDQHYTINIENGSGYEDVDFGKNDIDVAIRIGEKNKVQKGCVVQNLIKEELLCVCSPAYYKKKNKIENVSKLAACDLLNNSSRPSLWNNYFKFLGLKKEQNLNYKNNFEHLFMLKEAAIDGLGVALLPNFLVAKEINKGNLVKVFNKKFDSGYFYQLIYPQYKKDLRKITDFSDWASKIVNNANK